MTYFKDGCGGSHNFKVGGEMMLETGWYGYMQVASGNIREKFNSNGARQPVQLYAPTATSVGSLGDGPNGNLLSIAKVNTIDCVHHRPVHRRPRDVEPRRALRHYDVLTPDQHQLAFTFPTGLQLRPDVPRDALPEMELVCAAPRRQLDLQGNGKTVLKATTACTSSIRASASPSNANPNQSRKTITYTWTDANCADLHPAIGLPEGEEGALTAERAAWNDLRRPEPQAAVLARRRLLPRAAAHRGRRRARRLRLLHGQRPDQHVSAASVRRRPTRCRSQSSTRVRTTSPATPTIRT